MLRYNILPYRNNFKQCFPKFSTEDVFSDITTCRVRHIFVPERTLVMEDGTIIGLEDIAAISGFQFEI